MPQLSTEHINRALTNASVAYLQDQSDFISDKVFPMIPVKKRSDVYFIYKKEDINRIMATFGQNKAKYVDFDYEVEASDPFVCQRLQLSKLLTAEEISNADAPLQPYIDANLIIQQGMMRTKEKLFADGFFRTGVWSKDYTGIASGTPAAGQFLQWDNPASDPVGDIKKAMIDIKAKTGFTPTKLTMDKYTFEALLVHPEILQRIQYTQVSTSRNVNAQLLKQIFDLDEILVSKATYNPSLTGDDNQFIFGRGALLTFTPPKPAIRTPSAGYTFMWILQKTKNQLLTNKSFTYPTPDYGQGAMRVASDMWYDRKVIGSDLGIFFDKTVK